MFFEKNVGKRDGDCGAVATMELTMDTYCVVKLKLKDR